MAFSHTIGGFLLRLRHGLKLQAACTLIGVDPEWLAVRDCYQNGSAQDVEAASLRPADGDVSLQSVRAL